MAEDRDKERRPSRAERRYDHESSKGNMYKNEEGAERDAKRTAGGDGFHDDRGSQGHPNKLHEMMHRHNVEKGELHRRHEEERGSMTERHMGEHMMHGTEPGGERAPHMGGR